MAQCLRYQCSHCAKAFEAWDEGMPYLLDARGRKRYVPHPHPDRDKAIGVETESLCLGCGRKFKVDSRKPRSDCPGCGGIEIRDSRELEGAGCPFCKRGTFREVSHLAAPSGLDKPAQGKAPGSSAEGYGPPRPRRFTHPSAPCHFYGVSAGATTR